MIEILILLPARDLDLQHFNLAITDGDRGIPVYFSKICVNLTDVILQDLHDLVFLLFNHGDVHLKLFHQAFIGRKYCGKLHNHLLCAAGKKEKRLQRLFEEFFCKFLPPHYTV